MGPSKYFESILGRLNSSSLEIVSYWGVPIMLSSPPADSAAPGIQAAGVVFTQVTFQRDHEWKKLLPFPQEARDHHHCLCGNYVHKEHHLNKSSGCTLEWSLLTAIQLLHILEPDGRKYFSQVLLSSGSWLIAGWQGAETG